jgi:hypothetical protein
MGGSDNGDAPASIDAPANFRAGFLLLRAASKASSDQLDLMLTSAIQTFATHSALRAQRPQIKMQPWSVFSLQLAKAAFH